MTAEYNDVPAWRYVDAARFFGGLEDDPSYPLSARTVRTYLELEEVLNDASFADGRGLKIVDIVLAPEDVPSVARTALRRAGEALRAAESETR